MRRIPERGDIWHVDFEPVRGSEQRGARPVLVLTREAFNRRGLMMACPVTQGGTYVRDAGFAVSLSGTSGETQGVVLAYQARMLSWADRSPRFVEASPDFLIADVAARIAALLE